MKNVPNIPNISWKSLVWTAYAAAVVLCMFFSDRIVANAENGAEGEEIMKEMRGYYKQWYDLEEDRIILKLENHIPGYEWKLGSSDDSILETTDYYYDKYGDRVIVLEPEHGRSGDVILTAACMRNISSKPVDRRQLRVHVYEDGRMEVSEGR